jgi:predicted SAM-dependent methyltransferase
MTVFAYFKGHLKAHVHPKLWSQLSYLRRALRRKGTNISYPLLGRLTLLKLKLSRRKTIENYFARFKIRKLQLGAGSNDLPSWLSSEGFAPSSFTHSLNIASNYIYLDVCQPFPFEDNSLDYIFHEHVVEHLNYHQAQFMLQECFRILKPGGRIRIATPDLQVFVELYGNQTNSQQKLFLSDYVRLNSEVWSHDLKHVRNNHAVFVLNHSFRAWGHQFLYDFSTLVDTLESAGFSAVERHSPQRSRDDNLSGLEYRKEFVGIFDALVVEAQKPQHAAAENAKINVDGSTCLIRE